MREKLVYRLSYKEPLICDGSTGTMLQANGLTSRECPEMWNLNHPQILAQIASSYLEAGSDIIQTNSFGGSRIKLDKYDLGDQTHEINFAAAKIAREAAGDEHYVLASMGPTGEFIEPYGDMTFDQAVDTYTEQAQALAEGGADGLILETFSDLNEIKAALTGAKKTGLPVIAMMTFDTGGRTMMGVSPQDFVINMEESGATGIGSNCGVGPDVLLPIAKELCKKSKLPVVIEPNAGVPKLSGGKTIFPVGPEEMAEYAPKFIQVGVRILGTCCGSTPEHIRAIALKIKQGN